MTAVSSPAPEQLDEPNSRLRGCSVNLDPELPRVGMFPQPLVALVVAVAHTRQAIGLQYHWLGQAVSLSYLGVLTYRVFTLRTKSNDGVRFRCTNPILYVTSRRNGGTDSVTKGN
jgi:hypothetical protein